MLFLLEVSHTHTFHHHRFRLLSAHVPSKLKFPEYISLIKVLDIILLLYIILESSKIQSLLIIMAQLSDHILMTYDFFLPFQSKIPILFWIWSLVSAGSVNT